MNIIISPTKSQLGHSAALLGAGLIRDAIREKGAATVIVATGASQFEMLENLVKAPAIDWSVVTVFHLDEYVGMGTDHPASFVKYLRERFLAQLPVAPAQFYGVDGTNDPAAECARLGALIGQHEVDVCFAGIGENGHLAFNDPPANFDAEDAYLVVDLDENCRKQQLGEGWFATLDDVPTQAISMSVRQIMKSRAIICSIPDQRKAQAVKDCLQGPVTNLHPASILQDHPESWNFLDAASASLILAS